MKTSNTPFSNFVSSVHPDPDNIMMKQVYQVWDVIEKLAIDYHKAVGVTHCGVCGMPFDEIDIKCKDSRPKDVCIACFTSNA
jgi:hypothetical protein